MKKLNFTALIFLLFSFNILFSSILCDRCGSINPDRSMFCQDCGARLTKSLRVEKESEEKFKNSKGFSKKHKVCLYCKEKNSPYAKFCQNCGTKFTEKLTTEEMKIVPKKDTSRLTKAVIFSFLFPGVGHIYLGEKDEKTKGIIITSASAGLLVSSFLVWNYAENRYAEYKRTGDDFVYDDYSTSIDVANLLLVTLGAVWIYNIVDIYITTSRLKKLTMNNDIKKDLNIYVNFYYDGFKICLTKKFKS